MTLVFFFLFLYLYVLSPKTNGGFKNEGQNEALKMKTWKIKLFDKPFETPPFWTFKQLSQQAETYA